MPLRRVNGTILVRVATAGPQPLVHGDARGGIATPLRHVNLTTLVKAITAGCQQVVPGAAKGRNVTRHHLASPSFPARAVIVVSLQQQHPVHLL
jgi:hypothetical protein